MTAVLSSPLPLRTREDPLATTARTGVERLRRDDPVLHRLLGGEQRRQHETLAMIASASHSDPSVLACEGSTTGNVTTEGYPGRRYHAGCAVVDDIERLAVDRACALFGAEHANVQPHSGSTANQLVMAALLAPGDTVMGLELGAGGHLTHGAPVSFSGRYYRSVSYGVGADGRIDLGAVARLAARHRPKMIICGASAYPRSIDFTGFRAVADQVGAYLLADISHIAGLVATGLHASPVPHAHFTTTSTYKQLYGPRGGLVLMGPDAAAPAPDGRRTLAGLLDQAVFPYFQGTPRMNGIAAKARALHIAAGPGFARLARRILDNATALAAELAGRGWSVPTGGTDNHMVLVDVHARGLTGAAAETALESCGIVVNRNKLAHDGLPARVAGGVRFGTNTLALRGFDDAGIAEAAAIVDRVWTHLRPGELLDEHVRRECRAAVDDLCARHPLPAGVGELQPP